MHEVLVNRLGGLSLPRNSVVRLTDRPDMTLAVNRGHNTATEHLLMALFLRVPIVCERTVKAFARLRKFSCCFELLLFAYRTKRVTAG